MPPLCPEFGLGRLCSRRTVVRLRQADLVSTSWVLCLRVPPKSRRLPALPLHPPAGAILPTAQKALLKLHSMVLKKAEALL